MFQQSFSTNLFSADHLRTTAGSFSSARSCPSAVVSWSDICASAPRFLCPSPCPESSVERTVLHRSGRAAANSCLIYWWLFFLSYYILCEYFIYLFDHGTWLHHSVVLTNMIDWLFYFKPNNRIFAYIQHTHHSLQITLHSPPSSLSSYFTLFANNIPNIANYIFKKKLKNPEKPTKSNSSSVKGRCDRHWKLFPVALLLVWLEAIEDCLEVGIRGLSDTFVPLLWLLYPDMTSGNPDPEFCTSLAPVDVPRRCMKYGRSSVGVGMSEVLYSEN